MAFVLPTACAAPHARTNSSAKRSRRDLLQIFATGAVAAFLPDASNAQESGLPPGAKQFSRVLSAQKQWGSVRQVLDKGEVTDGDWQNLRGYLRSVYAISGDMEFIAKPWEKGFKARGFELAGQFRKTVKGMDKPAIAKDVAEFGKMHTAVVGIFDEFFGVFRDATVSDIPEEL